MCVWRWLAPKIAAAKRKADAERDKQSTPALRLAVKFGVSGFHAGIANRFVLSIGRLKFKNFYPPGQSHRYVVFLVSGFKFQVSSSMIHSIGWHYTLPLGT